jgi:UbiD family decarboxylase
MDLRNWLDQIAAIGEIETVRGANWKDEIGAITHAHVRKLEAVPALLFDDIVDYPTGFRVLANPLNSSRRLAISANLDPDIDDRRITEAFRGFGRDGKLVAPRTVKEGPILENVRSKGDVNLYEFPTPVWHAEDHARYIGTGSVCITSDPEFTWTNCGTYVAGILDKNLLVTGIGLGKHARMHREEWWKQGKPCPMVFVFGSHPILPLLAGMEIPWGVSELDYAGGLFERPVDVIKSDLTGLPIPAHAEIVVEGYSHQGETGERGRWGEWSGYYSDGRPDEATMRVERIYYRNNPILLGITPESMVNYGGVLRSGQIWNQVEAAGLPDVVGVWSHMFRYFTVIAIRQRYPGHARQAGLLVSQCQAGAYYSKFIVVVDEDIDGSDLREVMWAICSRTDPGPALQILDRCWDARIDPAIPPDRKGLSTRVIIDACRPYEWKSRFPDMVTIPEGVLSNINKKWPSLLR